MNLPEDYQNKMQKMLGGDEYLQYLEVKERRYCRLYILNKM